jgi:hypothetical protein
MLLERIEKLEQKVALLGRYSVTKEPTFDSSSRSARGCTTLVCAVREHPSNAAASPSSGNP